MSNPTIPPPPPPAPTPPLPPRPKSRRNTWLIVGGAVLGVLVLSSVATNRDDTASGSSSNAVLDVFDDGGDPGGMSMAEFGRIRNGMNTRQVRQIVGSAGEVMVESEIGDHVGLILHWDAEEGFGGGSVHFSNGLVISKSQFGL